MADTPTKSPGYRKDVNLPNADRMKLSDELKQWADAHPDDAKKFNDFSKWYGQYRENRDAGKSGGYRQDVNLPAKK